MSYSRMPADHGISFMASVQKKDVNLQELFLARQCQKYASRRLMHRNQRKERQAGYNAEGKPDRVGQVAHVGVKG